jgi:hypothetical protein
MAYKPAKGAGGKGTPYAYVISKPFRIKTVGRKEFYYGKKDRPGDPQWSDNVYDPEKETTEAILVDHGTAVPFDSYFRGIAHCCRTNKGTGLIELTVWKVARKDINSGILSTTEIARDIIDIETAQKIYYGQRDCMQELEAGDILMVYIRKARGEVGWGRYVHGNFTLCFEKR